MPAVKNEEDWVPLPEKGIQAGESAPEFELPEVGGVVVALEELLGAPIVLVFYRGSWWSKCNRQLGQLRDRYDEFEAVGARLVTISSQDAAAGAEWKAEKGFPFPLLSDESLEVIRAYDVYHENEPKGRDIARPSTFVLDADGVVRWRYVGERSSDRPAIDEVLDRVPLD